MCIDFVLCVEKVGWLGSIGEKGARAVFKKLDANGNGQLDMYVI